MGEGLLIKIIRDRDVESCCIICGKDTRTALQNNTLELSDEDAIIPLCERDLNHVFSNGMITKVISKDALAGRELLRVIGKFFA